MTLHPEIADVIEGRKRWCVVNADNAEILPTLPFTRTWLLCADPPYGISVGTANARKSRGFRPYDPKCRSVDFDSVRGDDRPFDPAALLCFGRIVLWGANHYASRLPDSHCWLAWDRKTERGAASDITDCELAWTRGLSFKTVRIFRHMWAGFQRDSEVGERVLHPTQKPVALFSWCLTFFPESDVVVDPFAGSGPCGVAALRMGRRAILIEHDPAYAAVARERMEAEERCSTLKASRAGQTALFGGDR